MSAYFSKILNFRLLRMVLLAGFLGFPISAIAEESAPQKTNPENVKPEPQENKTNQKSSAEELFGDPEEEPVEEKSNREFKVRKQIKVNLSKITTAGKLLPPPGAFHLREEHWVNSRGDRIKKLSSVDQLPLLPEPLPNMEVGDEVAEILPDDTLPKVVGRDGGVNHIADLPKSKSGKANSGLDPNDPLSIPGLEEVKPNGLLNSRAYEAYEIAKDLRGNLVALSGYLKNDGREHNKMIVEIQNMRKSIDQLAGVWPRNNDFKSTCGLCKREVVLLQEELNRSPRKWKYVEWAFSGVCKKTANLRRETIRYAELEPKPYYTRDKSGKPVVVVPESPLDGYEDAEKERKKREKKLSKARKKRKEKISNDPFEPPPPRR